MKTQPTKEIDSEYFDELLERASDGYDPYGYVDDNTIGEVCDFDWKEG